MQHSQPQPDGAAVVAAADPRVLPSQTQDTQDPWVLSAAVGAAYGAAEAAAPGVTAAMQPAASQGHTSSAELQALQAQTAQQQQQQQQQQEEQQQQQQQEEEQQQQSQPLMCQELPAASTSDLAALFAASGLQPQLCFPESPSACSAEAQGPEGLLGQKALLPFTTTAAAAAGQISPSSLACLWTPASESALDAAAAGSISTGNCSRISATDAAGSSSQAGAAAAAATAALCPGITISRSSSSSSAAMPFAAAGAGGEAAATFSLLSELNVSLETLMSLLTGGREDECEQPVWMVVNLQGKIKGSYTAEKMLTFCRRGTLSASQLLLGIDLNLPYLARQDIAFYRPLTSLVAAAQAGDCHYTPLTANTLAVLKQQGLDGQNWQPMVPQEPGSTQQGPGSSSAGGASSSSMPLCRSGGPAAAAAKLKVALERLCGCSVVEAMLSDSVNMCTSPQGTSAQAAAAAAAEDTAATADPPGPQVAAGAASAAATTGPTDAMSAEMAAAMQVAAEADLAAAAAAAGDEHNGVAKYAPGGSCSRAEPMWLYINHLGWCRGPFPGARVIQAHMCGRLPRDTLIAAHAPEVPSTVVSADIAYFFRPLGVLLDNVANGWSYNTITWADVATRDLAAASTAALPTEPPWQPLKWDNPVSSPAPMVNLEELLPPRDIIIQSPQQLPPGANRRAGRGRRGSWAGSSSGISPGGRSTNRVRQQASLLRPIPWEAAEGQQQALMGSRPTTPGCALGSSAAAAAAAQAGSSSRPGSGHGGLLATGLLGVQQSQVALQQQPQQQQMLQYHPSSLLQGQTGVQLDQGVMRAYSPQHMALESPYASPPPLPQQQLGHQQQQQQLAQLQLLLAQQQASAPLQQHQQQHVMPVLSCAATQPAFVSAGLLAQPLASPGLNPGPAISMGPSANSLGHFTQLMLLQQQQDTRQQQAQALQVLQQQQAQLFTPAALQGSAMGAMQDQQLQLLQLQSQPLLMHGGEQLQLQLQQGLQLQQQEQYMLQQQQQLQSIDLLQLGMQGMGLELQSNPQQVLVLQALSQGPGQQVQQQQQQQQQQLVLQPPLAMNQQQGPLLQIHQQQQQLLLHPVQSTVQHSQLQLPPQLQQQQQQQGLLPPSWQQQLN